MYMNVLVINGPNLARLDIRDSSIYGDLSYPELVDFISISKSALIGINLAGDIIKVLFLY